MGGSPGDRENGNASLWRFAYNDNPLRASRRKHAVIGEPSLKLERKDERVCTPSQRH